MPDCNNSTSVRTTLRQGSRAWIACAALLALTACGGDSAAGPTVPPTPLPDAVTALSINPATVSLLTGDSVTVTPTAATGGAAVSVNYSYATSAPAIASVNGAGLITALAAGSATITVTASGSGSGFTASSRQATVSVIVTPPVPALSDLTVSPDSVALISGDSISLTPVAAVAGAGVTVEYSYASNAGAIATVSSSGVITAVSPGSATVTITAVGSGSGFTTSERQIAVPISVAAPPVGSIVIDSVAAPLVPMQSLPLQATVSAPDGTTMSGRVLTWASSSATTVSVSDDGVVQAVAPGTATITAESGGVAGAVQVTVVDGAMIGPAGGTANATGAAIMVPASAVATQTAFQLIPVAAPPTDANLIEGTAWELGPAGSTFQQPVTVSVSYSPQHVPSGASESELTLHRWNGASWEPLGNATVDTAANIARGTTSQFSTFAVLRVNASATWTHASTHPMRVWDDKIRAWTEGLGRTWVVTEEDGVRIRSTTDGTTWTSFDPTTVGLPARPILYASSATIASTASEIVINLLLNPGGMNEAGHSNQMWVVRGDGQHWTVQGPETPGLSQYTPPPGARNFRFSQLIGAAAWQDQVVVAGESNWWMPYATSDASFLTFATNASRAWHMFARPDQGAGVNPHHRLQGIVGSPLGFFIVGIQLVGANPYEFRLWHTVDGTEWTLRAHPAEQMEPFDTIEPSVVLYAQSGLVLARRNSERRIATWHSVDGISWTERVLPETSGRSVRGLTAAGRYILYAHREALMWISSDGQDWESVVDPPAFVRMIAVGNTLLGITWNGEIWSLTLQ